MISKPVRIAVATIGDKGLEDIVSHDFGHSDTFTIVDVDDGRIRSVEVIQNPAASLSHGRGPVVAKSLANMRVNTVISGEIGPGASTMLNELGITKMIVKPGQKVIDVLKQKALIS